LRDLPASGEDPFVALVAFKSEAGYFSETYTTACPARTPVFRRGDCDASGEINITDAIFALNHLFRRGQRWPCDDACDSNDDGDINLTDMVVVLLHLFRGGEPPGFPGPRLCGLDLTSDFLGGVCGCQ
jgi:hypothetical protein